MKTEVTAILGFVAAFIITTAVLIFLNTQFKNIFKFDFTPVSYSAAPADSTAVNPADSSAIKKDSTKAIDSLKTIANDLAQKSDSAAAVANTQNTPANVPAQNVQKPADAKVVQQGNANAQTPPETDKTKNLDYKRMDAQTYEKWKKTTAGIIEAMDANKASQILRMYADNIGNELLYAMKKKKAAEILSKFDAKKDSLIIRKLTRIQ